MTKNVSIEDAVTVQCRLNRCTQAQKVVTGVPILQNLIESHTILWNITINLPKDEGSVQWKFLLSGKGG